MYMHTDKVSGASGAAGRFSIQELNTIANEIQNAIMAGGFTNLENENQLGQIITSLNTSIGSLQSNVNDLSQNFSNITDTVSSIQSNIADITAGYTDVGNSRQLEGYSYNDITSTMDDKISTFNNDVVSSIATTANNANTKAVSVDNELVKYNNTVFNHSDLIKDVFESSDSRYFICEFGDGTRGIVTKYGITRLPKNSKTVRFTPLVKSGTSPDYTAAGTGHMAEGHYYYQSTAYLTNLDWSSYKASYIYPETKLEFSIFGKGLVMASYNNHDIGYYLQYSFTSLPSDKNFKSLGNVIVEYTEDPVTGLQLTIPSGKTGRLSESLAEDGEIYLTSYDNYNVTNWIKNTFEANTDYTMVGIIEAAPINVLSENKSYVGFVTVLEATNNDGDRYIIIANILTVMDKPNSSFDTVVKTVVVPTTTLTLNGKNTLIENYGRHGLLTEFNIKSDPSVSNPYYLINLTLKYNDGHYYHPVIIRFTLDDVNYFSSLYSGARTEGDFYRYLFRRGLNGYYTMKMTQYSLGSYNYGVLIDGYTTISFNNDLRDLGYKNKIIDTSFGSVMLIEGKLYAPGANYSFYELPLTMTPFDTTNNTLIL